MSLLLMFGGGDLVKAYKKTVRKHENHTGSLFVFNNSFREFDPVQS